MMEACAILLICSLQYLYRVGQNTLPTFSRALWREGRL